MAKTKVSEFDAVASNNTDINSVNVAEGCPPSGINNAIREMASLLKKQEVGTDAMTSPDINGGTIDGATIGASSGVTIGVSDGTVSAPSIKFTSDTNTGIYRGGTDILKFVTAGTDAVTIDASQNVGIGTSSPFQFSSVQASLTLSGTSGSFATRAGALTFQSQDTTSTLCHIHARDGYMAFETGTSATTTERMRIDSSGNLMVGTTDTNPGNDSTASAGLSYNIGFGGQLIVRATANSPLLLNRTTSDGDIILFRKDGPDVGMIGTFGSALYMASPDGTDAGLRVGNSTVVPVTTTGALRDNAIDLGSVSARWNNLYLSGGVFLGGTGPGNKLDDYEEGTWTPVLNRETTSPTISYSSRPATYVKIGNMVYCMAEINVSSISANGSGANRITGLPFTAETASGGGGAGRWGAFIGHNQVLTSAESFYIIAGSTGGYFSSGSTNPNTNYSTGVLYIVFVYKSV